MQILRTNKIYVVQFYVLYAETQQAVEKEHSKPTNDKGLL